jgi:hypothetical protein
MACNGAVTSLPVFCALAPATKKTVVKLIQLNYKKEGRHNKIARPLPTAK